MRHSSLTRVVAVAFLGSSLLVGGCATKAQTGAAVGATGGAAAGGAIGAAAGNTAAGVIIGAVVGGAAGAIIGNEMDKQARELKQNIPGATVERVGEGIKVTFDSGLLFGFDSTQIKPAARTNLRNLAVSLDNYPETNIFIVGHTDDVGSAGYNQTLSERRAQSAADYLTLQGVARSRLTVMGLGEDEPVASNQSADGREQNRRVEIAIFANSSLQAEARKEAGS